MFIDQWAARWSIPADAIQDLRRTLGMVHHGRPDSSLSESAIQSLVRLEASEKGCRLWRNNVGATTMPDGSFLRFGLANESAGMNKRIKSADLIGIRPVLITPAMVGWTIGQFMSREVKAADWQYKGTEREVAQLRWAELIISLGGDAAFATNKGTI